MPNKETQVIELHTFNTPNGRKAAIALEELSLPYRVHIVDITQGQQFAPEFLAVSPNNKIPAIVDTDGPGGKPLAVFESGAILVYLAEKAGRLLPTDPIKRMDTLQWLFWQVGGVGPMFGQAGHFFHFAPEKIPYAIDRYVAETNRLLGVLEKQLGKRGPHLIGEEYTIADIAVAPWVEALHFYGLGGLIEPFPRVRSWLDAFKARPGVQRGWNV